MNPASTADSQRLLRSQSVGFDALADDFHLPPLEDPSFKGYSTAGTQRLITQSHTPDHESNSIVPYYTHQWTPFFLTRKCLSAFIGLWICLLVVLAVLFGYSQSHQGLSTVDQRLYYLWTYGPTAVLSIASGLWVQVVYRTKQLMPWKAMASGFQPASQNVLLDYVSPLGPVALYRAVSNSHHTVSLTVVSSFIMLALTVSSTGLFSLEHVDITTDDATLMTSNNFDFTDFDWTSTDSRPAGLAYATAVLGLRYPNGTTAQYAVQDFSAPQGSNQTLISVVDIFSAQLDCESANLIVTNVSAFSPDGPLFHSGGTFTINITSSDCTVTNFQINSPTMLDNLQPWNGTENLQWGYGQLATCVEQSGVRVLVSTGSYTVDEQWNGTESDSNNGLLLPYDKMFQIVNSTNILCKPSYTIGKARVIKYSNSTDSSQFKSIEPIGVPEVQLDGNQTVDIARSIFKSLDDPLSRSYYSNGTSLSYNTFFNIMQDKAPNDFDVSTQYWHEYDNLLRDSNALYGSIAAQVAALKLLSATNATTHGQIIENSPRLFVRILSFALMEIGFVMLVVISAYLLTSVSGSVVSHDPGSIAGLAIILSKSPALISLINGKECVEKAYFDASLQDHVYSTEDLEENLNIGDIGIVAKHREATSKTPNTTTIHQAVNKFWEPLTLRVSTRILIVLVTLAYIIVLEVLLIMSESRNGIVSINTDSWLHYGWTYVPALSMVIIGVAYDSANTNIKMINPYATMYKGSVPAVVSIQDHPLSRTSLHELVTSGKQRQIAVFLTSIATLLASLLPIAVSGLYDPVGHNEDIEIHQLTTWTFATTAGNTYPNSTMVNNAFVSTNQTYPGDYVDNENLNLLTSLIVTANLSYPAWSYDELAFPLIEARMASSDNASNSQSLTGSVNVTIPAVRGALNCSVIPSDYVDVTYPTDYNIDQGTAIQVGNYQCLNYTWTGAQWTSNPDEDCRIALFSMRQGVSLNGCSLPTVLVFLPQDGGDPQPFGFFQNVQSLRNHTYCPSYMGMLGTTTTTSIDNYTWFACSTEAERVDVRTTLALPEYRILSASADEGTVERVVGNASAFLFNDTGGANMVTFTGPNSALNNGGYPIEPNQYLSFFNMPNGQNFDNFFSCLVYGRDGVPASAMLGQDSTTQLFAAVQHLWRVVCAQQLRTDIAWMSAEPNDIKAWAPNMPWNATFNDPNAYRLKQSVVSTRILQGLLAAMAVCGILAFIALGSTSKLLPHNPSSIAVVASLLAGSEFLSTVERLEHLQIEKTGGKELHGHENRWAGYLFSLGWWNREAGGRRFGIDIGRADPAR